MKFLKALCAGLLLTAGIAGSAAAQDFTDNDVMGSGKLLATGGVTELEGAGGGGITPWALITGYETNRQVGASAFGTYATTGRLTVSDGGVAIGLFNRVEISFARLNLNLGSSVIQGDLNLLNKGGNNLTENIEGAKVRLFGDAVYDQYVPEVSAGVLLQQSQNKTLVNYIGAKSTGETYYLAATKLYFDVIFGRDLLLDADIIGTKANQLGLLGFGSTRDEGYHPEFAGSAAILLTRGLAVGADFRTMPRNLKAVGKEGNWSDLFIAYLPNKHFSVTAAYAMLGDVATGVDAVPNSTKNQNAFYISGQLAF